jgi:cytochrome c oxidase subunit 2
MLDPHPFVTAVVLAAGVTAWTAGSEEAKVKTRSFEITASRFEFEPDLIEVGQGDRVVLTLRSADVTHGIAIKAFKVEKLIPKGGEPVSVEFVADKVGRFRFDCSEYCGAGHKGMKGQLVVSARGE